MRLHGTDLGDWLMRSHGIAHREDVLRAGFPLAVMRAFVRDGGASMIRRAWLALPSADPEFLDAAHAGGRLSCTTLARRRGWWMPASVPTTVHLHMVPGSGSSAMPAQWQGRLHWTRPLAPSPRHTLVATLEDSLLHLATCLPFETALVLWESAIRVEQLAADYLRSITWPSLAARELADAVTGLSDSGLETLAATPLRRWGLQVQQQAKVGGRLVDLLVGERLVIQIDGYAFHADSSQRTRDISHDAELRLRGYTVLRFSYAQVIHDWPAVAAVIRRAVAAGLHRAC